MGQNVLFCRNCRRRILVCGSSVALSIWHKKKESAGKRRTAFFVDMAQLYTDCKLWIIVLCIMPVCQCRPEPLSHYQYKMDVDFSGNCASDEL